MSASKNYLIFLFIYLASFTLSGCHAVISTYFDIYEKRYDKTYQERQQKERQKAISNFKKGKYLKLFDTSNLLPKNLESVELISPCLDEYSKSLKKEGITLKPFNNSKLDYYEKKVYQKTMDSLLYLKFGRKFFSDIIMVSNETCLNDPNRFFETNVLDTFNYFQLAIAIPNLTIDQYEFEFQSADENFANSIFHGYGGQRNMHVSYSEVTYSVLRNGEIKDVESGYIELGCDFELRPLESHKRLKKEIQKHILKYIDSDISISPGTIKGKTVNSESYTGIRIDLKNQL